MSNTKTNNFRFAAIDPYKDEPMILPTETLISSKDMMEWGTQNVFPDYLQDLYNECPTLHSIIAGNVDYTCGDNIGLQPFRPELGAGVMNLRGDTIAEQVRDLALDRWIYGGFALQIIRNFAGDVAEVYYIDMRFLRTNKDGNVFYYCEDWAKKGRKDVIVYPTFMPRLDWAKMSDEERNRHASSILFVKNSHTRTYPQAPYGAALKACEMERMIDDFHIADLNNHFVASAIINFNNGEASDEVKKQIEDDFNEKFGGVKNGGRIAFSWNPNKESQTEIQEFEVKDFGERYKSLATWVRQQIFASFRAIPLLFGLTSEANTGFSTDEFEQSYKLYARTMIRPVQRQICDAYDKIFGRAGVMTITPFSIAGETETEVN